MTEKPKSKASTAIGSVKHEVETKGIYVAIVGLYVLAQAGVFSFDVPPTFFVVAFVTTLLLDAYR